MTRPDTPSLDEIVRNALALPDRERMAYIQHTCSTNLAMLEQVLSQLKVSAPKWWELSLDAGSPREPLISGEHNEALIGKYRVLRNIGSGGMGEVVLAERADDQFRQKVAIKLVRRGAPSQQTQSRLKLERQILASLDHPNIARLLDGGATPQGTPYIVMEYVDGIPVDIYCDKHRLTVEQRLSLFQTICSAVACAHQNLVVHRDLKPSNILVTADGVPKLLDFGIAKLLDDRHVFHTMAVTQIDVRVMTPDHASPEQVRGDPITTASDIYALGILLYELLTGALPYSITSQRLVDIEKAICDQPPLPLAHRLIRRSDAEQAIQQLCALRQTTPAKLLRELKGDLADIVMYALRKEPERRYSSVTQFAEDVGRYLRGQPILARKDTWLYRTEKFVRRNALGVAGSVAGVLALIAFSLVTAIQSRHIAAERARAEHVSSFLIDLFEKADPSQSRGNEITVRETVDAGAKRISRELSNEPDTGATLLATIGQVYHGLGLYDDAVRLLEQSLATKKKVYGEHSVEVATIKRRLGDALLKKGDLVAAEPYLQDALTIFRMEFADDSVNVAVARTSLGKLRLDQRRFTDAEGLLQQSLNSLLKSPSGTVTETLDALNNLAIVKSNLGDHNGEEQAYRQALKIGTEALGEDHPQIAITTLNLAVALQAKGDLVGAGPLFDRSLALCRRVLGAQHPYTIIALASYGTFLYRKGDLDQAANAMRETLDLDTRTNAPLSRIGYHQTTMGLIQHDQEAYADAEVSLRSALKNFSGSLPPTHPYVANARRALGLTLIAQHRDREAEQELRLALTSSEAGGNRVQLAAIRATLGRAVAGQRRFTEAEPLLLESFQVLLPALGADHPLVKRTHGWIEDLYSQSHKPEQADVFFASLQTKTANQSDK